MAYVVARQDGRFEIRESQQTEKGPRARTLASFRVLSDAVLTHAADRAQRPFDARSVLDSGRRAGAPIESSATPRRDGRAAIGAFLAASRQMASTTSQSGPDRAKASPGAALIELLGFADAVKRSQPSRPSAPLAFPVLARFAARQRASHAHGAALPASH